MKTTTSRKVTAKNYRYKSHEFELYKDGMSVSHKSSLMPYPNMAVKFRIDDRIFFCRFFEKDIELLEKFLETYRNYHPKVAKKK